MSLSYLSIIIIPYIVPIISHLSTLSICLIRIGDTSSDTIMGRNGGCGLTIGVLSGSGSQDQLLRNGADIVLPNIGYLKEVVDSLCPRRISVSSDDSDSSSQSTMRASPVNPDDVTVVTTNATAYVL